jgi:hypothetical protein
MRGAGRFARGQTTGGAGLALAIAQAHGGASGFGHCVGLMDARLLIQAASDSDAAGG